MPPRITGHAPLYAAVGVSAWTRRVAGAMRESPGRVRGENENRRANIKERRRETGSSVNGYAQSAIIAYCLFPITPPRHLCLKVVNQKPQVLVALQVGAPARFAAPRGLVFALTLSSRTSILREPALHQVKDFARSCQRLRSLFCAGLLGISRIPKLPSILCERCRTAK